MDFYSSFSSDNQYQYEQDELSTVKNNFYNIFENTVNYSIGSNDAKPKPKEIDPDEYTKEEREIIEKESFPGNKFAAIFAEVNKKKDRETQNQPMPNKIKEIKDNGDILIDIMSTDPIDSGRKLYDKRTITLHSNCITPLVGCNGAGKSTMIDILHNYIKEANFPHIKFDNLSDGGHNAIAAATYESNFELTSLLLTSSEGESMFKNVIPYLQLTNNVIKGKYKRNEHLQLYRDTDHIFFFLDAMDSGFSIDNISTLKDNLYELIEKAKAANKHLYIIAAANSFELARNCNCWDVQHSKYIKFGTDYEMYRKFIINSRKRILKQWENIEKKLVEEKE